jgi:radical SAM superfamily enzyme YgiQ (UPF0313 family)
MRVLLINPPPFQRVDQYDTPDFPRLGLACLAGALEDAGTGRVVVVDAKFERLGYGGIIERVRAFAPDVVGFTAMTNEVIQAARVAGEIKRLSPGIVTVVGGSHVSALPMDTLAEFQVFDYGVTGDGEITFRELVSVLAGGGDPGTVPGVVYWRDGNPSATPVRKTETDLDLLGQPEWRLLPRAARYLVSTQRGCPFNCPFCANPNGRVVRQRSVPRVLEEMTGLVEGMGARSFYVCDEVFGIDLERTHRLLDGMIAAGLDRRVRWTAATHVKCADRGMFKKMKAAGCSMVEVGIEAGDPGILAGLGKGVTVERAIEVRKAAAEVGLAFGALMIMGHPGETWESANRTIDLAVKLNSDQTIFGIMVPYPGTEVAAMARRGEGGYRLIARDWNDYGKQHGNALEMESLSRRQLELLQAIGYVQVFVRNGRLADLVRFAWRFRHEGWGVLKKVVQGSSSSMAS